MTDNYKPCGTCGGCGVVCRYCGKNTDVCDCARGMDLRQRTEFEADPPSIPCPLCAAREAKP